MPTIPKGSKVLVSGANGYIAMWVVQTLLERGYAVRGTVRTANKGKFMADYFEKLGYKDKLEVVIVEDIVKECSSVARGVSLLEGAFDDAVKGVDAIEHTASPFHTNAKDPQELIQPAVQGTVGMLKSALKNGSQVKRIVVTSSTASIMAPPDKPTVFSERDWNTESPKEVEELSAKASPMTIYRASKTLAEKAAWEFYNQHKSQVQWDLAVINPPFVFGPPIHDVSSPSSLNTSVKTWYDMVLTEKTKEELSDTSNSWVDVRDVALGHVLALEKDAAGGERIITNSGTYNWQEWLEAANSLSPNPLPSHTLAKGHPEILQVPENERVYYTTYDKSKEEKILGIKFHTKEETARDTLLYFARMGW